MCNATLKKGNKKDSRHLVPSNQRAILQSELVIEVGA